MQDKRQLKHQYKEQKLPMGLYLIRNLCNQKVLLGAAQDVEAALNRHRFELQMKSHRNKALLQDWLRDGAEQFSFETVALIQQRDEPEVDYEGELAAMYQLWAEELQCFGEKGYN